MIQMMNSLWKTLKKKNALLLYLDIKENIRKSTTDFFFGKRQIFFWELLVNYNLQDNINKNSISAQIPAEFGKCS